MTDKQNKKEWMVGYDAVCFSTDGILIGVFINIENPQLLVLQFQNIRILRLLLIIHILELFYVMGFIINS
jgi:hypothetical protein